MGRRISPKRELARSVGVAFGTALGEGLRAGLAPALSQLDHEFKGTAEVLVARLRELAVNALAMPPAPAEESLERRCTVGGCDLKAVARGRCRRHYAQLIYRERRERNVPAPRTKGKSAKKERGPTTAASQAPAPKVIAPVAPTVRRKGAIVGRDSIPPAAAGPAPTSTDASGSDVQVDDVARFFGLK